jgi:hypothetical protein
MLLLILYCGTATMHFILMIVWVGLGFSEGILFSMIKNETCTNISGFAGFNLKWWLMGDMLIRWIGIIAFLGLLFVFTLDGTSYQQTREMEEDKRCDYRPFTICYIIFVLIYGSMGAIILGRVDKYCIDGKKFGWWVAMAFTVVRMLVFIT